ncbi:MAG: hypothetical protein ACM3RP_13585 [Chitinophagales bacterium]
MRVPSGFLAAMFALLIAGSAALPAAAGTSVGVTVTTNDPQAMAGVLMLGAMAAFFGAQQGSTAPAPAPVPAPAPQTGVSVTIQNGPAPVPQRDPWADLPAWYVASFANVPVERVIELRRTGHHWTEIVERYRLPEEFRGRTVIITENRAGKHKVKVVKSRPVLVAYTDDEFERYVSTRFIEDYYGVPRATVVVWLNRGLSLRDVYLAVNLAARVHVRPDVIVRYRLAGEPWEVISRRHKVPFSELGRPVNMGRRVKWGNRGQHGDDGDND